MVCMCVCERERELKAEREGENPTDVVIKQCMVEITLLKSLSVKGTLVYNAQSPDEAALVNAARNFGYVFKVCTVTAPHHSDMTPPPLSLSLSFSFMAAFAIRKEILILQPLKWWDRVKMAR